MIKNERQFKVTQAQARKFEEALAHLEAHPEESAHLHPLLQKAERDALRSQMKTLQGELAEYERHCLHIREEVPFAMPE